MKAIFTVLVIYVVLSWWPIVLYRELELLDRLKIIGFIHLVYVGCALLAAFAYWGLS